jgi:hypothetical protein
MADFSSAEKIKRKGNRISGKEEAARVKGKEKDRDDQFRGGDQASG